jgi:hypothetical protein
VNFFIAALYGAGAGVVSLLLHQTLPPFGVIAGLLFTYLSIWWVGRRFHARKFKMVAFAGWFAVMLRAASFGTGQELLVQGDAVGTSLLLVGTLVALAAVAARN